MSERENEFTAYFEIVVRDKDGNVVKTVKSKSRSWLKNMASLLNAVFRGLDASVTLQNGTSATVSGSSPWGMVFKMTAGSGDDTYGILIGSGTAAVTPDDYKLASKIANSKMGYGAVSLNSMTPTSSAYTAYHFTPSRTFTNSSSSSITVSEAGIAVYGNGSPFLVIRDTFSAVSVPAGGSLTITYDLIWSV